MPLALQQAAARATGWLDRQSWVRLCAGLYIFSLVLALAVGFGVTYRTSVAALDFDEWEYWQLGSGLLAGEFNDSGRRTAGFPLVLAGLRLLTDDFRFVQMLVTAIAATAPPLLAMLVQRMGAGRLAAVLAGLALAAWPAHLFLATSLYSETVALPLLLLLLICLPDRQQLRDAPIGRWLLCGVVLAILAHVRTMYQLFVPVVLLILLLDGGDWRAALKGWALVLTGFLLGVLPWSVWVSAREGAPMLLTANGGETIAGGLNARLFALENSAPITLERRATWVGPGKWIPATETGYLSAAEQRLPYPVQDKLLRERTMAWIAANPGEATTLTIRKLTYQWGIYPWSRQPASQVLFGNLPIVLLLVLTPLALVCQPAARRLGARFYLLPLFVSGIAVISWGSWRFRHPADAMMLAIVAVAAAAWLRRSQAREGAPA